MKFVVLQSHSQSICELNQCHIKINTYLLRHIETFCLSPLFFTHTKFVSLLLLFSFNWLTTIHSETSFQRKEKEAIETRRHFFRKRRTYNLQSTTKANSLPVSNFCFERSKFASTSFHQTRKNIQFSKFLRFPK